VWETFIGEWIPPGIVRPVGKWSICATPVGDRGRSQRPGACRQFSKSFRQHL